MKPIIKVITILLFSATCFCQQNWDLNYGSKFIKDPDCSDNVHLLNGNYYELKVENEKIILLKSSLKLNVISSKTIFKLKGEKLTKRKWIETTRAGRRIKYKWVFNTHQFGTESPGFYLDSLGKKHISFSYNVIDSAKHSFEQYILYGTNSSGKWNFEIVDSTIVTTNNPHTSVMMQFFFTGSHALTVSQSGNILIMCTKQNSIVSYSKGSSNWIKSDLNIGCNTPLSEIKIKYINDTLLYSSISIHDKGHYLCSTKNNGLNWTIQDVPMYGNSSSPYITDIEDTKNGEVIVLLKSCHDLSVASFKDQKWSVHHLYESIDCGSGASLVVDEMDRVHVTYIPSYSISTNLMYFYRDSTGNWGAEEVAEIWVNCSSSRPYVCLSRNFIYVYYQKGSWALSSIYRVARKKI